MEQVRNEQIIYSAAVYCRLSKDDEQAGESVSIETQKMMLTDFCHERGFSVYEIYADDGYSGLNFNRPAFTRLLEDIDSGKINLVITKNLSRLGRGYIQTGYYTDVYFSRKRVRYIAVNDGIDTNRDDNDIAPFKNILNDMYAKDLSRKVKSAKRQKAYKGYYISAQAPYGYKVDPTNRNRLIVDEEAAEVVKEIFHLALAGHSLSKISRILSQRKIITPGVYKAQNGDTRFSRYQEGKESFFGWCYQTVRAIRRDQVYTGDMVNHKVEIVNYKTKEWVRVPKWTAAQTYTPFNTIGIEKVHKKYYIDEFLLKNQFYKLNRFTKWWNTSHILKIMGGYQMSKKNSGWGHKRTVVCFVTLAFLFLALGILMCEAGIAVKQAEELSQAVFRLHIVANSDSTVDQELKLKVRDAIAVEMEKLLDTQENPTKEETMDLVTENIETFQNIGQSIVEEAGFDYQVTAMVCNQAFPTKEYLSLTLPAWDYDCLRVDIGAGEGQNWWCVLFPQLCFKEGIVGKLGPEEEGYIEDTLSTDTVEMITVTAKEKPVRVQVRFKIVEIIQSIKEAFRED